jgi:glycine cleavage system transcriptional repressor
MPVADTDHLVITAVGGDRPGIVNRLSTVIVERNCNISDSRMAILGGEFAVILLVNGTVTDIEQLQRTLDQQQQQLGLTIITKPTHGQVRSAERQHYIVEVVTLDQPGVVQRLTGFFAERNINIADLSTASYAAPHTGTAMFELQMRVDIPTGTDLDALRDQYLNFCEGLDMDTSFEIARDED